MKMERYDFCGQDACAEWLTSHGFDKDSDIPCEICKKCMTDGPASFENPNAADLDREVVCGQDPEKDFKSISERAVSRILDCTEDCPVDYELPEELAVLIKSASSGSAESYVAVGNYFRDMARCADSETYAIHWYAKAAQKDDPWAMWRVGSVYLSLGEDIEDFGCDNAIAFACFRRAAELGGHDGAAWVGKCYVYGRGVPVDREKALTWLTKAARQGNTMAGNFFKKLLVKEV